jgi:Zn-dependent protease
MPKNGIRLFQVFGITVYLHWSWLVVAVFELQQRSKEYHSPGWNVAEYLALFAIVLMHEFGHALACRSVGGKADRIILWPLGGVAYVSPPMRPGAMLWSIVAGPLVNVLLAPVTWGLAQLAPGGADLNRFLWAIAYMNLALLIFNMLPIYPLDGGKILWALLWFVLGMARSLMVASVIGMAGAGAMLLAAIYFGGADPGNWLFMAVALFAVFQAWVGFNNAREIHRRQNIPMRAGFACPNCGAPPPKGPFWVCSNCRSRFDLFESAGRCPTCGTTFQTNACMACGARTPIAAWVREMPPEGVVRRVQGS